MKLRMAFSLVAMIGLLAIVNAVMAHTYLNSSDPGCDGSDPNVVLCDDFEDGSFFDSLDNAQAAANDGWYGSPQGSNGSLPYATCGSGVGAVGTSCTAFSISTFGGDGGGAIRGEHGFGPNPDLGGTPSASTYAELYFRFYLKTSLGFQWTNSQKIITYGAATVGAGGIDFGGTGRNNELETCPVYDCNDLSFANPQNNNPGCVGGAYLCQNQGNLLDLANLSGRWVFVELHVKLNTPGVQDGIFEMWLNDCGVNGLECTGTPTLRARFTNVRWRSSGETRQLGKFFWDVWGNPSVGGTLYIDQLKVSRVGPIGFISASGAPPSSADGVSVQFTP